MTRMLELDQVSRRFRGGGGVDMLELEARRGEIVALVGLNGAGKTTLMRLALGMLRPDAGTVRIGAHALPHVPADTWRRVGHLIEVPLAYPELTTRQSLRVSATLRGADPTCVDAALARWRLEPYADRRVRRLSLGNRQRVGLAAALQHDPDLVVLDEPTNALDPAGVLALRDALVRRADAGAAVLVSSHHLDEVARIADRIAVINAGRVIGALEPSAAELERVFFERVRLDDERRAA
jgi:ABC-2 type transport system ATP-binding protein